MSSLTHRERQKIEAQMVRHDRGPTWTGLRPCIMQDKRKNEKRIRQESKAICRAYCY